MKPLLDITREDLKDMTIPELEHVKDAAYSAHYLLEYQGGILSYEQGQKSNRLLYLSYAAGNELSERGAAA